MKGRRKGMGVVLNTINPTLNGMDRLNTNNSESTLPSNGVLATKQPAQEEVVATSEVIKSAAETANDLANVFNTNIKFKVHEETNVAMLQIVDARSGEVIKELPPATVLDMMGKLWDTIGLIIDKKA